MNTKAISFSEITKAFSLLGSTASPAIANPVASIRYEPCSTPAETLMPLVRSLRLEKNPASKTAIPKRCRTRKILISNSLVESSMTLFSVEVVTSIVYERRRAIVMAASTASAPLSSLLFAKPALSRACLALSTVSRPKPIGTPYSNCT